MKSVLISIHPEWCEKICHEIDKDETGKPIYEKRIEVRKSAPKEVPFKAYIYEIKGKKIECGFHFEDTGTTLREKYVYGMHKARIIKHYRNEGRGRVIGEFICNKVDMSFVGYMKHEPCYWNIINGSCLTKDELMNYGKRKTLYGWHISDLKIYDKPKELSEFYRPCSYGGICYSCNRFRPNGTPNDRPNDFCDGTITRPPQSWQYVDEVKV